MIPFKKISRSAPLLLSLALIAGSGIAQARTVAAPASVAFFAPPDQPRITDQPRHKANETSEEEAEEERNNTFRRSPTVKWFADLFHTDVETMARIFEYINFAVIVLAVGIPLFKFLPRAMKQRTARLNAELDVAKAKTDDANARLSAVEAKMAGLDAEIEAIRKQVEKDMKDDEAHAKAQIEEESARIVKAAEQEIIVAAAQAQRGLKQFAADLAIDRALSQLTVSADADHELIAEFVSSSDGKKHARKGGQN